MSKYKQTRKAKQNDGVYFCNDKAHLSETSRIFDIPVVNPISRSSIRFISAIKKNPFNRVLSSARQK